LLGGVLSGRECFFDSAITVGIRRVRGEVEDKETFGNFLHSDREIASTLGALYTRRDAVMELTNALGDQHCRQVAIPNFLDGSIE
jgi:hypothetical protein